MKTEQTSIEWAHFTFNPWRGCTEVSPACDNCYARTLSKRNPKVLGGWGEGAPRVLAGEPYWRSPVKWNADAQAAGVRYRVFCASLSDWLDWDGVPTAWRVRLLNLIEQTPHLDWLLLTKRPESWYARLTEASAESPLAARWLQGEPPANVWVGATVEDQTAAHVRIPELLEIPARLRFLSCEPLLGPVNLQRMSLGGDQSLFRYWPLTGEHIADGMNEPIRHQNSQQLHWIIAGGESGGNARPSHPVWYRSLRDQCINAGVPFLFKQHGEWVPAKMLADSCTTDLPDTKRLRGHRFEDGTLMLRAGKACTGNTLDGRQWLQFPA